MPGTGIRFAVLARLWAFHLFSGLAVGYCMLDRRTYHGTDALFIMAGPIASASLIDAAALAAFPRLLPGGRVVFPVNITLPIVFLLLVRASVILWTSPQSAAFRTADPLLPALLWTRWPSLLSLGLSQAVLLTTWMVTSGDKTSGDKTAG